MSTIERGLIMKRLFVASALGLATLSAAAPAHAQTTGWLGTRPAYSADERQSYFDSRRAAYDTGYREGLNSGRRNNSTSRWPF